MGADPAGVIRRLANLERILNGFQKRRIAAKGNDGSSLVIDVLASSEIPGGDTGAIPAVDPFYGIVSYKEGGVSKTGIQGGVVFGGNKTWQMGKYAFNPKISGKYYLWITMSLTVNIEDGVLLPGLKTTQKPDWGHGSSYPEQTLPTAPSGNGKIVLAVGELIIENGSARFSPTGNRGFGVFYRPGTLYYSRT